MWAECVAWLTKVHPRSRGEYGVFHPTAPDAEGSSPLSRGIQTGMTLSFHLPRFIPALAGNTLYPQLVFHPWRVHPRSRGEYFHVEVTGLLGAGSSPLSRGILRTGAWIRVGLRFIPALAGNTPHLGGSGRGWPVHPRSRGEYFDAAFLDRGWLGSSPLSRGIRSRIRHNPHTPGFIPALAGNTQHLLLAGSRKPVHPRSRGEYGGYYFAGSRDFGSSPLSRGIPIFRNNLSRTNRFIPALAGNTDPGTSRRSPATVHPRSRGEYDAETRKWVSEAGSSPLSRGILEQAAVKTAASRFIPALAGNTIH